jgi:myo-inositol-1(or 4)-monophosphatase
MQYREFLQTTLASASGIAKEKFGKVSGSIKGVDYNQVLTETDLAIGNFIIKQIMKVYPTYNIIDEEAGVINNHSDFTWVVDPIDGTSNFAAGSPLYGIMIGLLQRGTPVAGGVVLPSFDEFYFAEKGHGAFLNGTKIHVTEETRLLNTLVVYSIDGHQEQSEQTRRETQLLGEIVLAVRNIRNSGSTFDSMMVAKGNYGAILNQTSRIWDNVANQIIIEEAGGLFTTFDGDPIDYSDPINKSEANFTQCAAAPQLHKQLQGIIKKYK